MLTNPPFGKKSSISIVNEEGELEKEDHAYERQDFWTTTKNKQLNFLQHVHTLLKVNGRCAIVVPDNVLFEGGAGETVRRNLLQQCDVHTLLRLPTGLFYAQGVKANVLFFDEEAGAGGRLDQEALGLRPPDQHALHPQDAIRSSGPTWMSSWSATCRASPRRARADLERGQNPEGRWRAYDYEELVKRDKVNLDLFWLRDKSLEDSEDLPEPDVLAAEIVEDLEAALEQFQAVAMRLERG